MTNVHITGIGMISALGDNCSQNLYSLQKCLSGIRPMKHLDSVHKDTFPVGEVQHSKKELGDIAEVLDYNKFSRADLLAIIAAKEAIFDSRIDLKDSLNTGIISGSSAGGMSDFENHYLGLTKFKNNTIKTHYIYNHVEEIMNITGLNGYSACISTACSSSANAIMNGARMVKTRKLDRAIVGGVDSLSKFILNGFNSLNILDNKICKPFDENRNGLNLGEGAAYIVLESEEIVRRESKRSYGKILGYANTNDAYHQTSSSSHGHGAQLAMQQALHSANISSNRVSYINTHGTATINNDDSEGMALLKIFGNSVPLFSSTKSYTGHTLGAAGAIEAIISILSITNKTIFPNLNWKNKMVKFDFEPVHSLLKNVNLEFVLTNSFGFGGNNTSLIISK